jgi:hypothetical protein
MNPGCIYFLKGFRDALLIGSALAAFFLADRFLTPEVNSVGPQTANLSAKN